MRTVGPLAGLGELQKSGLQKDRVSAPKLIAEIASKMVPDCISMSRRPGCLRGALLRVLVARCCLVSLLILPPPPPALFSNHPRLLQKEHNRRTDQHESSLLEADSQRPGQLRAGIIIIIFFSLPGSLAVCLLQLQASQSV